MHMSEFTPFPRLSKMSVAISTSQMRKLKLRKASGLSWDPQLHADRLGWKRRVWWLRKMCASPLLCHLSWCKRVPVWKGGGRLEKDLCICHLGTEEVLAKPDPAAQVRSLGLRATWGQRGLGSCLLAPPLTAHASGQPACLLLAALTGWDWDQFVGAISALRQCLSHLPWCYREKKGGASHLPGAWRHGEKGQWWMEASTQRSLLVWLSSAQLLPRGLSPMRSSPTTSFKRTLTRGRTGLPSFETCEPKGLHPLLAARSSKDKPQVELSGIRASEVPRSFCTNPGDGFYLLPNWTNARGPLKP